MDLTLGRFSTVHMPGPILDILILWFWEEPVVMHLEDAQVCCRRAPKAMKNQLSQISQLHETSYLHGSPLQNVTTAFLTISLFGTKVTSKAVNIKILKLTVDIL